MARQWVTGAVHKHYSCTLQDSCRLLSPLPFQQNTQKFPSKTPNLPNSSCLAEVFEKSMKGAEVLLFLAAVQ